MKKTTALLIALVLILLSTSALADTWICPNCGRTNTKNFCADCGTKLETWFCTSCGEENISAFCENCGAAKADQTNALAILNEGGSMNDTISDGDLVIGEYRDATEMNRFDIVFDYFPARGDTIFIKRLIGLPGDKVEQKGGYLYINDERYNESYINDTYRTDSPQYTVPKIGDQITISINDTKLSFQLNGEDWDRKKTPLSAKGEDAKQLKIFNKARKVKLNDGRTVNDETIVISYDGNEWEQGNWDEIHPLLTGKTFTIDQDYYFVLGDHRNNSNDSRYMGALPPDMLIGVVTFIKRATPEE